VIRLENEERDGGCTLTLLDTLDDLVRTGATCPEERARRWCWAAAVVTGRRDWGA
jgi:hypothetical protein